MSSRFPDAPVVAFALLTLAAPGIARELRVCADPDNLPYSSHDERGFENRIAHLIAADLHAELRYYWHPQWRGFTRKTLLEGHCDVIPGMPVALGDALATRPYYRGTYAFVYSSARMRDLSSLDDPRLRTLRIGLQIIGIDATATPPGRALAKRGIVANVVGFPVMGATPSAERMIAALANGMLDVAIIWSPQAGYFAAQRGPDLDVVPLRAGAGDPAFEFPIGMGVRRDDVALKDALDASLVRLRPQIDAVLREYAVLRTDTPSKLASP